MATAEIVDIDHLELVIRQILEEYGEEVRSDVSAAVNEVTKGALKEVKAHAPVDKGTYKKSLTSRKEKDNALEIQNIIHARAPHYALSHLLENGHQTRNGGGKGWVDARPHFRFGQEYVEQNFERIVKSKIEGS